MSRARGINDVNALVPYARSWVADVVPQVQIIGKDTLHIKNIDFVDRHEPSPGYMPGTSIVIASSFMDVLRLNPVADGQQRILGRAYNHLRKVVFLNCLFNEAVLETRHYRGGNISEDLFWWCDNILFEHCHFDSFRVDTDGQFRTIDVVSCALGHVGVTAADDEDFTGERPPYAVSRALNFQD